MTLRCGRIKYTNDLPIYAAFDAGAIEYPGTLHADAPARLNAMLLGGELDLSPISAFTWAANARELVLLPDLCIGARDEVVSVVLVSPVPPVAARRRADLRDRRIGERAQPAARHPGAPLRHSAEVLWTRRDPLERALRGEPTLLIGDSAIDAIERFPSEHVYDLGRLWHEWTGQQTVFAVWAARRDAYERDPARRARLHARADRCVYLVALARRRGRRARAAGNPAPARASTKPTTAS